MLSGADGIEANRRKVVVSWHLRQSHGISQQNPSAGRLFELLRRNLAIPDTLRMDMFVALRFREQRRLFLRLEPLSVGLWVDARVTRMMNSLGDFFEVIPYIRNYKYTSVVSEAFNALLHALSGNTMVPWFDEALLKQEASVGHVMRNGGVVNRDALKLLRDRVVNTGESYSFESKICIIPKLVLYIDRASLLINRINQKPFVLPFDSAIIAIGFSRISSNREIVALVTALVDTSLSILADSTKNNRNLLVSLAEAIRTGTAFIDANDMSNLSTKTMVLQTAFEFYHRFGVVYPVFLDNSLRWSEERVKSIRIIMKSFLIFGKQEWNKLLLSNHGNKEQHFAELFSRAPQSQVDKAARFLARQALCRMKLYTNDEFQDDAAPLFSPAEWLKLYMGGRSRYALWELNFSPCMTARDPVAVFGQKNNEGGVAPELKRLISSYLPFDRNTPTELSALAHEISAVNDEIRYSPRISLLRSISNSLLRLPRLILQAEAEVDILRGDKYIRWREILIKSARSLTATLREAATSDDEENLHMIANINHIEKFTKKVVRILEDMASPGGSARKNLFLKYKFDKLESLTHRIDRLQTDILNGQHTEGL